MTLYLGENLISGVATSVQGARNIGQLITSLLPISDAGLHLVDGSLIDGSGMYASFVDYVSSLDLSANYFCTENEWQTSVAQYGVCGKFVYDATANTVRLPKVTGLIEGTIDVNALGDLVEAGLPNITGSLGAGYGGFISTNVSPAGALYSTGTSGAAQPSGSGQNRYNIGFDASLSNPIYSNSDTVQPQTVKGFVYIVIATSAKTDVEVNIDNIATDVNSKADVDLSNISASQSAKDEIVNWVMPDMNASITLANGSASTPYNYPYPVMVWTTQANTSSDSNLYVSKTQNGTAYVTILMGFSGSGRRQSFSWLIGANHNFYITNASGSYAYPLKGGNY